MTCMPASRRARATTLTPRSWPSSPTLASTMRIGGAVLMRAGSSGAMEAGAGAKPSAQCWFEFFGQRLSGGGAVGLLEQRRFSQVGQVRRTDQRLDALAADAVEGQAQVRQSRGDGGGGQDDHPLLPDVRVGPQVITVTVVLLRSAQVETVE